MQRKYCKVQSSHARPRGAEGATAVYIERILLLDIRLGSPSLHKCPSYISWSHKTIQKPKIKQEGGEGENSKEKKGGMQQSQQKRKKVQRKTKTAKRPERARNQS
jgi:hypothetical protein